MTYYPERQTAAGTAPESLWRTAVAPALSLGISLSTVLFGSTSDGHVEPSIVVEDIAAAEANHYTELVPLENKNIRQDRVEAAGPLDVVRYADLEGLSFARPSSEIVEDVRVAATLEQLDAAAEPYFAALRIRLHLTDTSDHQSNQDVAPIHERDLEHARDLLQVVFYAIGEMPREVMDLSATSQLYLASGSRDGDEGWDGNPAISWSNEDGTNSIALNVRHYNGNAEFYRLKVHHEFGHNVEVQLNRRTHGGFDANYVHITPDFVYENPEQPWHSTPNDIEKYQLAAAERLIIGSTYQGTNLNEDQAGSYESLWTDEGTPDPGDISYGMPVGHKRVLWIEYINHYVPNFRNYMIGRAEGRY